MVDAHPATVATAAHDEYTPSDKNPPSHLVSPVPSESFNDGLEGTPRPQPTTIKLAAYSTKRPPQIDSHSQPTTPTRTTAHPPISPPSSALRSAEARLTPSALTPTSLPSAVGAERPQRTSLIGSDAVRHLWAAAGEAAGPAAPASEEDYGENDTLGEMMGALHLRTARGRPAPSAGARVPTSAADASGGLALSFGGGLVSPGPASGPPMSAHAGAATLSGVSLLSPTTADAGPVSAGAGWLSGGSSIWNDQRSNVSPDSAPGMRTYRSMSMSVGAADMSRLMASAGLGAAMPPPGLGDGARRMRSQSTAWPATAAVPAASPQPYVPPMHRRAATQSPQEAEGGKPPKNWTEAPTLTAADAWLRAPGRPYTADMPTMRRHSVAGPLFSGTTAPAAPHMAPPKTPAAEAGDPYKLMHALDQMNVDDVAQSVNSAPFLDTIDDYFDNPEHRARAWIKAGRDLEMMAQGGGAAAAHPWPLFVVEFKAGRTDFFYIPESSNGVSYQAGDLVIVEADRGKDLGKIIVDNITSLAQLQSYQDQHADTLLGLAASAAGDVQPKMIIRRAQSQEVALLVQKSKDEADAFDLCSRRIKQKKLPMQVIDGEFQWDRRKLTFYFVSDRRIDFRDLVKELFKIYKTRIWMCQLSPQQTVRRQPASPASSPSSGVSARSTGSPWGSRH